MDLKLKNYQRGTKLKKQRKECKICKNKRGVITKMDLFLCRICFRERAKALGFERVK